MLYSLEKYICFNCETSNLSTYLVFSIKKREFAEWVGVVSRMQQSNLDIQELSVINIKLCDID